MLETSEVNKLSSRNNSIEFFRFLFMIVICMWHFNMFKVFKHGYLAVEFFFILSGFFLYKSYIVHSEQGVLDFLLLKFKRFFPEFVIVLFVTFIMKSPKYLTMTNSFSENFSWLINILDDSLFLFSTGPFVDGIINPTWYLSVLIWGGTWLYAMLKYNHKLSLSLLFPLFIVLFLGYIRSEGGNLELWFTENQFFLPLARGMAEMAIGVYLNIFYTKKNAIINESYTIVINIMSVLSLFLFGILLFVDINLDMFSILLIPFIILGCLIKKSWFHVFFSNKIWGKLGGITYEMLLVHWSVLMLFRFFINKFVCENSLCFFLEIIYLLIIVILSFLLKKLYEKRIKAYWNKY